MKMMDIFHLNFLLTFLVIGPFLMQSPTISAQRLSNSTLSCTRGSNQTFHDLDCKKTAPIGLVGLMFITRVFYGTPPISSGCNRTASYSICCERHPEVDCVFESDVDLKEIVKKFSGLSYASFPGERRPSSLGGCNSGIYPNITSFSFVEFGCASVSLLKDITADINFQDKGEVHLGSNVYFNNSDVRDASFHCVAETDCNSTVSIAALFVKRNINSNGECPEEFYFDDVKHPDVKSNVTCHDGDLIFNTVLFTSVSNAAIINMTVYGNHTGMVFIKVSSSDENAPVHLTCGTDFGKAMESVQKCPDDPYDPYSSTTTSLTPGDVDTSTTAIEDAANTTTITNIRLTNNDNDLSPGTIAGIVLATIAIFLVLALLIGLVILKRRKNTSDKPPPYTGNGQSHVPLGGSASLIFCGHTYDMPDVGTVRSTTGTIYQPPSYVDVVDLYDVPDFIQESEQTEYHGLDRQQQDAPSPNACGLAAKNWGYIED